MEPAGQRREVLGRLAAGGRRDLPVRRAPGDSGLRSGIGIPDAEQKDIFRKFIRGSEAKVRGLKGTGIGLAMVRHIVEGHGGEIRWRANPTRAVHSPFSFPRTAHMTRILVVEDEPGIAFGLETDLTMEGTPSNLRRTGRQPATRAGNQL